MNAVPLTEIEIHNSGSRMRKTCRFRWSLQEVGRWQPRRRSQALWVGSALDRALKRYYELKSRQNRYDIAAETMTPITSWDEPFWDEAECRREAWNTLEEYLIEGKKYQMEDDVAAKYDQLAELARTMWISYQRELDIEPDEFEVIIMGRQFRGRIGNAAFPQYGLQNVDLFYGGEFDGLILWQGKLYVFENKTADQPQRLIDSLPRDEQASRYHWAVRRMVAAGAFEHLGIAHDTPVWGTLFNILWKRIPVEHSVNLPKVKTKPNDRMLSKVGTNTWAEEYLSQVKEFRPYNWDPPTLPTSTRSKKPKPVLLEPVEIRGVGVVSPWIEDSPQSEALKEEWEDQHKPELERLNLLPWRSRVEVDRNDTTLQMVESQLYAESIEEVELRMEPQRIYRNPTFACAIACPVVDVCTAHFQGQPIAGMLDEFYYQKGGPNDPYLNGQFDVDATSVPLLLDDDMPDPTDDLPF